jgi:predicted MarR family transcription regulator
MLDLVAMHLHQTTEYMTDIVDFALQRATNIHYRWNVGH